MRPTLEYYMASLDNWPFEVGVDLSLIDELPKAALRYRAHVRLELNHPTENGMCTAEEDALLSAIQEEVLASLDEEASHLVAVVTHRNARTLVIHLNEAPEPGHPLLDVLDKIQTHRTTIRHEDDPNWDEYRNFLFPNDHFMHQIRDRRVLREFERRGDDCGEVHSIEPRFVGLSQEGAELLSDALREKGFLVKGIQETGANGTREFQLTAAARSPLALPVLDDFREVWMELAERVGGRYDGWSAELVPVSGDNNNTGCGGHLFGRDGDAEEED